MKNLDIKDFAISSPYPIFPAIRGSVTATDACLLGFLPLRGNRMSRSSVNRFPSF